MFDPDNDWAWSNDELTLPMTQEESDNFVAELMEQSYDAACTCLPEIYREEQRELRHSHRSTRHNNTFHMDCPLCQEEQPTFYKRNLPGGDLWGGGEG